MIQWPGQNQAGEAKIPSLVWYDGSGQVSCIHVSSPLTFNKIVNYSQARAFGAEARSPEILDQAEDYGWHLAKHFKLHLHPNPMRSGEQLQLDPLPPNVTIDQIYADFMGYLFGVTRRFFMERILDGENTWTSLEDTIEFVIAHPNGWDVGQQSILLYAAVAADLVPSLYVAQERIHFVSEAEASVHYVLVHADLESRLKVRDNINL